MRQTDRPVQIIYAIERRQISRTDAARALSPIECRILPQSGSRTFFDASAAPSDSNVIFALVAPSQRRFRSHFAQTYHNIPIDVRCFSQQHVHSRFSWTLVSSSMRSGAIHGLFPWQDRPSRLCRRSGQHTMDNLTHRTIRNLLMFTAKTTTTGHLFAGCQCAYMFRSKSDSQPQRIEFHVW